MRNAHRQRLAVCAGASLLAFALILGAYIVAARHVQSLDIPAIIHVRICGNGITDFSEDCDDGTINNVGGYASSTALRKCNPSCFGFGPYCGDGILQVRFNEQCDDGNNTDGDLCSATCTEEIPVQPRAIGAPPRGSVPQLPAPPGTIPSETITKVVLQGKAYPNSTVSILLDGKLLGTVLADSNADFLYTTTNVSAGTASFSFTARDRFGNSSLTTTNIFNVVQSAVTTVANIFLPPTISAKPTSVAPGGLVVLSGQAVPNAHVIIETHAPTSTLSTDANAGGDWSLQVDTGSLKNGDHTAKALFQISSTIRSGFGRSVNFFVGTEPGATSCGQPDMNGDSKVNLVDFSIFLLSWDSTDAAADYNCDQNVNLADFSILLFSWTG